MVRRYEEQVEVRATREPEQFMWRGRLFVVREVIDQWQERGAWWRDPGEASDEGGPRQVWRVAASAGRHGVPGVYDLGAAGAAWTLLRAQD